MLHLFRRLLWLLPRDARQEYGDELVDVVGQQRRDLGRDVGRLRRARFWSRQLRALVLMAVHSRLRRWTRHEVGPSGDGNGRKGGGMDGFWHDVSQAARALGKRPGFTFVSVVTLGLGIGASTSIFSAVHAVLIRELPYGEPHRIVALFHEDAETGERGSGLSPANARDLRERSELLTAVAVAEPWSLDLEVEGRTESVRAWAVSSGFFEALDTEPILGRGFTPEEYVGGEPVVLVGHRSWQNRFGADPELVGRVLDFQQGSVTVVGILGPGFKLPDEAELWVPRYQQPHDDQQRTADYMLGVGRTAPGATLDQVQEELHLLGSSLASIYPESNATTTFRAVPLRDYLLGDVRTPLLILFSAVGLVLLIACANVAGLMLARGVSRRREYALRGALGASVGRLVRQIGIETVLIAGLGCLMGIALAAGGTEIISRLGPDHLPRIDELRLDGVILAFAVSVAGVSALLSGITPSFQLSRSDLAGTLMDGGRASTGGPSGVRLRRRLVVAEVAAAVVLLLGAGLLSKSFTTLLDEDLGFDPTNRLAVQVFAYDGYESAEERSVFVREAIENMEALAGIERVALTSSVPGATDGVLAAIDINLPFTIEDRPAPPVGQEPVAAISQVSAGFFDLMDMRVVDGRGFTSADRSDAPSVVVVNESLARRHFGDVSPVGEHLVIGYRPVSREIVGVVADIRAGGPESVPRPEVYFPISQFGTGSLTFVARTQVEPGELTAPAMDAIWEANPAQAIWGAATLEQLLADWLVERRFNLLLMGSLATIALALAGVGIYGLMSFSVEHRVSEMGVRRALGSESRAILTMVLAEGARLAGLGLVIGLVVAYSLTGVIRGMLHGVEPADPLVLVGLVTAVLAVACTAAFVPALRATRADPMHALRTE